MSEQPLQAYCTKCRQKQDIDSPRAVFLGDSSRPAMQGICQECGTKVTRFGRTSAHDGLDPAAHTLPSKASEQRRASGLKMVIVESPAKARTIGRFLGRGYSVTSSVGHIRDLPANRMGVDIEHDFEPHYVIPTKKKDVVKELRATAKQASEVYLATDPDREGEAIAWHLRAALDRQLGSIPVHRVEFHEITNEAINHAFAHPRQIDQPRVDAQQARRILDRVVGYTLSPLLRDKIGRKGLSAGRVQSVALRLVCEREREIQAFVPVEYWTIEAELCKEQASRQYSGEADGGAGQPAGSSQQDHCFTARLLKIRDLDPDLKTESDAQQVLDDLEGADYIVDKVTRRERRHKPAPPFMTSTLQQEASQKLRYTARRTMGLAQALYEGKEIGDGERVGLITYMRTDSVNVAESAQAEARELIQERYGQDYLPPHPPQYKTRAKSAQEAHEAIRPTSVLRDPASLKDHLTRDELRLYRLIWQRFVASQMAPAILDQTSVDILAGRAGEEKPYLFRATGSVIKFPGFLQVYEESREEEGKDEGEGVRLPLLEKGEMLELIRLLPKQHFTQPPPRYTDASLIRALEAYGIGRPSTFASILTTLLQRNYVEREDRKLIPTELGFVVNDLLVEFFSDIVNVDFTAEMEEKLDQIAIGEQEWIPMLHEFYEPFAQTMEVATAKMPRVEIKPEPTGELCPKCGEPLVIRPGRYGKFIACSGWPECRYTGQIPLPGVTCPECGGAVVEKRTRSRRRFYGCATYPACEWATWKKPIGSKDSEGTREAKESPELPSPRSAPTTNNTP